MQSTNSFYLFLLNFSISIEFLPFIIGLKNIRYIKQANVFIFILLCISILTEVTCEIIGSYLDINNTTIYNAYIIIEMTIIYLYYNKISNLLKTKFLYTLLFVLFFIIAIYEFFTTNVKQLNTISFSIESFLVILFSLITFFYLLKFPPSLNITATPVFWINSAFLLYFAGNFFLHLFCAYLIKHQLEVFLDLWGPWHSILNIMFYSLISVALCKTKTLQM